MKQFKIIIAAILIFNSAILFAQDDPYYPKGNPDILNIEFNPFLWVPAINGEISSENVSKEIEKSSVELLQDLRFAFMFNMDISKGKFFTSPTYIYAKLAAEETVKTDKDGNDALVGHPGLIMNIFELPVGMRFKTGKQVFLDPFIGVRYTNYTLEGWIDTYGPVDTTSTSFEESANYWDPILGIRVHYYPTPRVPITFKTDIGGFGAGSKLSYTMAINAGYTLSPTVDLMAGFMAYGSDFKQENDLGNDVGLNLTMYGFDLGIRVMIPARHKDPEIFKKKAK